MKRRTTMQRKLRDRRTGEGAHSPYARKNKKPFKYPSDETMERNSERVARVRDHPSRFAGG